MDAEVVRDIALSVSGLLVEKFGGPSAKPYQPDGYLAALNFPKREYSRQPRRRSLPPRRLHLLAAHVPASQPADVRRADARGVHGQSRQLQHAAAGAGAAERSDLRGGGARLRAEHPEAAARLDDRDRLGFRARARPRTPTAEERRILDGSVPRRAWREFRARAGGRGELRSTPARRPCPRDLKPAELAAMTTVARAILNLHETITRN